ncbi:NmrA domain-containing protein [Cephalotus follicularis]|uniref:NmrA domain-containing protein n=1 Tax=Cephalotus follicularis TaxID=3775 RepID=A0A1Q3AVE0_CEPFO|nr:NmrA domain-containing protein [Cephalotus follicularis]
MTVSVSPSASIAKGRVLIVGATGFIGQFVAEASLDSGRPTYILVRSSNGCGSKATAIKALQDKGALILHGLINDTKLMEKILRDHEIEIVISAVGGENLADQLSLVEAIKAVDTVKRFLPSEFGHDVDRANPVEPGLSMYVEKRKVRRLIEDLGVPYTYICCNSIASWPYHDNTHPSQLLPPLDQFQIYGDGSVKAYFVAGNDIGKFTMKTVDDIRTLNKSVHFRPSCNLYSINELASLWEMKIGRTLPRVTVTENDLLAAAAENRLPQSVVASFTHDIFIKGCQVNFSLDDAHDLDVGNLYPDVSFRNLDECFNDFAIRMGNELVTEDGNSSGNPVVDQPLAIITCA